VSGGRIVPHVACLPVLLLTTTGRRTGRRRTVPLGYFEDGSTPVLIASKGGAPRHPAWYLNLEAEPAVDVQIGRDHRPMQARRATADEAAALWPRILAVAPRYERFRAKTTREIPLVLLEPR
jgi:deazaflavin-dependent oxidoreductase (nitroreductase family)